MVCECFVVAWRSAIHRTSATSCNTFETENEPLSVIINVGSYAFQFMISTIVFAVFTTVGLDNR